MPSWLTVFPLSVFQSQQHILRTGFSKFVKLLVCVFHTDCVSSSLASGTSHLASATNVTAGASASLSTSARSSKTISAAQPIQTGPGLAASADTTKDDSAAADQKVGNAAGLSGMRDQGVGTFAMLLVTAAMMSLL